MSNGKDNVNIDEILREFQKSREKSEKKREIIDFAAEKKATEKPEPEALPEEPGAEDFSLDELPEPQKPALDEKPALKPEKEEKPAVKKEKSPKPEKAKEKKPLNKKALIIAAAAVALVAVIAGCVFGINYAKQQSDTAYLQEYQKKYRNVVFPKGILEEYCDIYGENPDTVGVLKISDISLKAPLTYDDTKYPYLQKAYNEAETESFVVYLDDGSLEKYYKDADSYNKLATGIMTYSDLTANYTFKVVGAFYTNTRKEHDMGYVFPYNVPEYQTNASKSNYLDHLRTRFLYSTGVTLTTGDRLLIVSCPTDFFKDFRFVVVGVMRDNNEKYTASEKSQVHYPTVICAVNGWDNPYKNVAPWYPEIIIGNPELSQTTKKLTAEDYEPKQKEKTKK